MPKSVNDKQQKADTIIYENQAAKEKPETEILHLYETKETIIKLKNPSKKPKSPDTTALRQPIDTTIVIKKGSKITTKPIKTVYDTGSYCKCVEMRVKTSDTLEFGQYINYSFIFKNNCKETVHINSSGFYIQPYNFFGQKVKVLRKIAFVKRFDIPEYVTLSPKDSFEYRFADDPFFEFDIRKAEQYKFKFFYSNTNNKVKKDPRKTYLCTEIREQMIFVK